MRDWLVGGALIEGPDGLLLVCNRRRDGSHDWSTPGGVIEEGEELLAGLAREVEEETGLVVTKWADGPVYEVRILAPEMGWRLRVEAHRALAFSGELRLTDPDGIVVDARFVDPQQHEAHLSTCSPWVREPLLEWLTERWELQRGFAYDVVGQDRSTMKVTRR